MAKDNLDPPWGQLAYHFLNAAPLGEATRALDYFERAGHQATASFAHSQALEHFERALQVEALLPSDDRRHLRIQLAVGFAARRSGDISKAQAAFAQASRSATALGASRSGAAALGYASHAIRWECSIRWKRSSFRRRRRDRSRRQPAAGESPPRSGRPFLAGQYDAPSSARRRGSAAARRLGDPATLAIALASKTILFGTTDLDERLGIATEATARGGSAASRA
jgi:hypothetical protein